MRPLEPTESADISHWQQPVSLLLERRQVGNQRWQLPQWQAQSAILREAREEQAKSVVIHHTDDVKRVLWSQLILHLYKDGAEGYWYNLLSDTPYLFVICDGEQHDDDVEPILITVNQDEANGHLESDDLVLSCPLPSELCAWLERYVTTHYQPVAKKKRKRREWFSESEFNRGKGQVGDAPEQAATHPPDKSASNERINNAGESNVSAEDGVKGDEH